MSSVLLVKHIPSVMSEDSVKEFFFHYGAADVKLMQGKMKGGAFVTFRDPEEAKKGLMQLHGLKVLDKVLSAEPSREKQIEPAEDTPVKIEPTEPSEDKQQFDLIAPSLGVSYPPNPYLEYRYPNPNPLILTNIVNAMTSRPKFYIQVLHLMNKMNLPPPFGPPAPALPLQPEPVKRKRAGEVEEEEDSEDDEDAPAPKRAAGGASGAALAQQLIPQQQQLLQQQLIQQRERAEQAQQLLAQQQAQQQALLAQQQQQQLLQQQMQQPQMVPPMMPQGAPVAPSMPIPAPGKKLAFQMLVRPDAPQQPPPAAFQQPQAPVAPPPVVQAPPSKYISAAELEAGRVSMSEIKQIDKKYDKGDPSPKLYIKNLAFKQVEISDLERIFGKFFSSEQAMRDGLDIKLMKEGRMKGQAFVTFQDEELAEEALEEVNGFKLYDKPMIIQYGKLK